MPRPRFKATPEERKMVEALSGYGVREDEIAQTVREGIDPKTLRKHFRRELDHGAARANAAVAQTAYKMAVSGQHPAMTMFYLKCRAGWKEKSILEHSGPPGGPLEIDNHDQHIEQQLAAILAGATRAGGPSKVSQQPASEG